MKKKKPNVSNLVKKTDYNTKVDEIIINNWFNNNYLITENKLKKLETFDSIYFCGKSHFEDDGTQSYSVFQVVSRYFKTVSGNDSNILSWKSQGLSDESIKPPTTSNKIRNPSLDYVGTKIRVKF